MKFKIAVKWAEIEKARKEVVSHHASEVTLKGFRKGKAPAKLVEESIGEKHIIEDILDHVLPKAYAAEVTEKKLKPLTNPKITPLAIKNGQDWEFEIEIAQKPEFTLGDYKKHVKTALAKVKKPTAEEIAKNPDQDPQLVAIFDALLDKVVFEVPSLLVEQEVNNQLDRLATQIQKLGLSIEKYLESTKQTVEAIRAGYEKSATNNLKLEFILQALITDLDVKVEDKEIDDLINSVGDESAKAHLNTKKEREGISYMIAKRKVVDALKAI